MDSDIESGAGLDSQIQIHQASTSSALRCDAESRCAPLPRPKIAAARLGRSRNRRLPARVSKCCGMEDCSCPVASMVLRILFRYASTIARKGGKVSMCDCILSIPGGNDIMVAATGIAPTGPCSMSNARGWPKGGEVYHVRDRWRNSILPAKTRLWLQLIR